MEQQIQDLVASIRKEGIDSAKAEAERIISEARAQADAIVKEAEKERDKMIADAEKSIALEKSSSEATIKQAARDVSLSLRKRRGCTSFQVNSLRWLWRIPVPAVRTG